MPDVVLCVNISEKKKIKNKNLSGFLFLNNKKGQPRVDSYIFFYRLQRLLSKHTHTYIRSFLDANFFILFVKQRGYLALGRLAHEYLPNAYKCHF